MAAKARLRLDGADPINKGQGGFSPFTPNLRTTDLLWRVPGSVSSGATWSAKGLSVSAGAYATLPYRDGFNLSGGQSTVFFVVQGAYASQQQYGNIISKGSNPTTNWSLYRDNLTASLALFNGTTSAIFSGNLFSDIFNGQKNAVAWVQAGGNAYIYINGILRDTKAIAAPANGAFPIYVGQDVTLSIYYTVGVFSALRVWQRALTPSEVGRLGRDPWAGTARPVRRSWGETSTTVSLSGSALTTSAGSVAEGIAVAATGSAATSAAGAPTSAIASTLAGSAGTAAAGTATSGIGMSLTGGALTVSAGSLSYTIGFTLTGSAATSAGGTLTSSGGDTNTERSLTGIRMTALPGNVRVTGGTRWRPSEAQAVTPPSMVGNTLQPPPRLVGDPASDNRAIQQWLQTLYDHVIKRDNVLGRIADHETRIASLEASNDNGST